MQHIKYFLLITLLVFCTLFFFFQCSSSIGTPVIGDQLALRCLVETIYNEQMVAGTWFVARYDPGSTPFIFTVQHIFGPEGGLKYRIGSPNLTSQVKSISLKPITDLSYSSANTLAKGGSSIISTGHGFIKNDTSRDVAAFTLTWGTSNLDIALLSDDDPVVGEKVWIVGDEFDSQIKRQRLYRCKVKEVTAKYISLSPKKRFSLNGFSGAPVINIYGEVVGMTVCSQGDFILIISALNIRHQLIKNNAY